MYVRLGRSDDVPSSMTVTMVVDADRCVGSGVRLETPRNVTRNARNVGCRSGISSTSAPGAHRQGQGGNSAVKVAIRQ